jgi:integrase
VRSEWISNEEIGHILFALTTPNRLACEVSLATGLRINDCLNLKTEQVRKQRFTVREQKTGKTKSVRLPSALQREILSQAGTVYAFEGRTDGRKPRTRQAVFKDLQRANKAFRLFVHISPHTLRKIYAVEEFKKDGDLQRVKKLLNHSDEAVTMIYALADQLRARRGNFKKIPPS